MIKKDFAYPVSKTVLDYTVTGKLVIRKKNGADEIHVVNLKKNDLPWKTETPSEKILKENMKEIIRRQYLKGVLDIKIKK